VRSYSKRKEKYRNNLKKKTKYEYSFGHKKIMNFSHVIPKNNMTNKRWMIKKWTTVYNI